LRRLGLSPGQFLSTRRWSEQNAPESLSEASVICWVCGANFRLDLHGVASERNVVKRKFPGRIAGGGLGPLRSVGQTVTFAPELAVLRVMDETSDGAENRGV